MKVEVFEANLYIANASAQDVDGAFGRALSNCLHAGYELQETAQSNHGPWMSLLLSTGSEPLRLGLSVRFRPGSCPQDSVILGASFTFHEPVDTLTWQAARRETLVRTLSICETLQVTYGWIEERRRGGGMTLGQILAKEDPTEDAVVIVGPSLVPLIQDAIETHYSWSLHRLSYGAVALINILELTNIPFDANSG